MSTIIYLIRHSIPMNHKVKRVNDSDSLQVQNEKNILSVEGEKRALFLSEYEEFKNIDKVIASKYVRAIATAKYIADKNNLDVLIDEKFGERKFGINDWNELPEDFGKNQLVNENYKIGDGESLKEVGNRMYEGLIDVIKENNNKKIVIVSHATAILSLFKKIGTMKNEEIYVDDNLIFSKKYVWNAPEVFKLEFNDNKLINIKNIREIAYE